MRVVVDSPPAPVPDDKDWTWVLDRPCPECGWVASTVDPHEIGGLIRTTARAWRAVLDRPDVRDRPAPAVWAPLEYAAHVRDVHRVYLGRLDRMLTEEGPHYDNWDQDATALAERYDRSEPAAVADELTAAATAVASRFDSVAGDQWQRTGYRSDGASFTVESIARYYLHDIVHHLWDVGAPPAPVAHRPR